MASKRKTACSSSRPGILKYFKPSEELTESGQSHSSKSGAEASRSEVQPVSEVNVVVISDSESGDESSGSDGCVDESLESDSCVVADDDCGGDESDSCVVADEAASDDNPLAESSHGSCSTSSTFQDDLGCVIKPGMSADEIDHNIQSLVPGEKYKLLTEHFIPSNSFVFPKIFDCGCNRSFQVKWLKKYPWLVYSKELDGGFCKYCALFIKERHRYGVLINRPFTKWVKVNKIVGSHASTSHHISAVADANAFKQSIKEPERNVDVYINTERAKNIQQNRHIVKCCAECVLYCGRQCIALRGDKEKINQEENPGNFLALLKVLAEHDSQLKSHLYSPKLRNATYLSPKTQNQVIDIIGKSIIQSSLVDEVNSAGLFSIMVDEITSFNKEFMPLCVRFVDSSNEIREEFLKFSVLTRITGEAIASCVLKDLSELKLDVKNVRGQGYDGAANMSSERIGLQALIRAKSPLALYMHCTGHCLNLVIGSSCSLPMIRNVVDKVKSVCNFFLNSPKRNQLLIEIVTSNVMDLGKRAPLIDLCKTRWAARHNAYSHFYACFKFLITAFEVIGLGLHTNTLSTDFSDASWDPDAKSKSTSFLHALTDFGFIVVFLVLYQFLSHMAGITIKLQGRTVDIVDAHNQVGEVLTYYESIRGNINSEFHKVYSHAERMAESVGTEPCQPRTCARQTSRPNVVTSTVEEWYKVNVAIPFLDHIISDLKSRFSPLAKTASSLLCLVPSILCSDTNSVDFSNAVEMYSCDMPSPELIDQEISRWKHHFLEMPATKRPSSCASAIKACDSSMFPNVFTLLKIACTIPVTSCECERNASTIRRLRNFMRCSMTEDRLTSLALMHIHYQHTVDLNEVVDIFSKQHPRRLQLSTLFQD